MKRLTLVLALRSAPAFAQSAFAQPVTIFDVQDSGGVIERSSNVTPQETRLR